MTGGDDWVINGQKIWTSLADVATHIWLAVRTDPDLPKHQGISVFVVPTDTPGPHDPPAARDVRRPHLRDVLRRRARARTRIWSAA